MKCKLCLQEKTLCKESHIISNFMYKPLFGDKNIGEEEGMAYVDLKKNREHQAFTGEFEADVLCQECEGKISRWETYARTVLYGGTLSKNSQILVQNQINKNGAEFLYVQGIDYKLFKLFLLSVLWRASISSRPFFENVSLGPFEEKIRCILMNEDAGKASSYPCVISSYKRVNLPDKIIGQPRRTKNSFIHCIGYAFLIHGTLYYYFVSENVTEPWILEAAVSESGELRLLHIPKDSGIKILNSYFGQEIFK